MIRRYWPILLVLLLAAAADAQTASDRPIRRITEYQITGKGQELLAAQRLFNEQGWLLEEEEYDSDGKLKNRMVYEYNPQGLKTKETHFGADGKVSEIRTYEYDANGNRTRRVVTDGSGRIKSEKKITYEYYR
ncbi:MAG: hypothetical protein RMK52_07310 [Chitinophagales bacterium]|nr:hypothetical protein [Chitinophagales bacterium]MDW8394038.1 hypothetical protein [Chitinophagales bacterium]